MRELAAKILSRKDKTARKAASKGDKPNVTTGRVLKYMFMPDLGSRFRDLGRRLGVFAYFLAQIFYSCRLIPPGHPVLQPSNIGYFGFSDVISTAASNLTLKRENMDQIIMFSAVILSMVLLISNGVAIAAYTVFDFHSAFAGDMSSAGGVAVPAAQTAATAGSMFVAPHPDTDLALQFLDRVFGASNVTFFSKTSPGAEPSDLGGAAVKEALYHMLGLYSTAMMVIAVIIVLYYAFTVVGESAMTGQPFGKRFNSFWAPIRLVVGLGLLVPIAGGLNSAQYITLFAAKMGSGFASYAWTGFVQELAKSDLISKTTPYPSVSSLVYNIVRFETCAAIANKYNVMSKVSMVPQEMKGDHGQPTGTVYRWDKGGNDTIKNIQAVSSIAAVASPAAGLVGASTSLLTDNVPAACGEIFIPNKSKTLSTSSSAGQPTNDKSIMGASDVQASLESMHGDYRKMIDAIRTGVQPAIQKVVDSESKIDMKSGQFPQTEDYKALTDLNQSVTDAAVSQMKTIVDGFRAKYEGTFRQQISQRISSFDAKGWMGAGMFYTQIADINGGLSNAISNAFPRVTGDVVAIPSKEEMAKAEAKTWFGNGTADGAAFDNETMAAMTEAMSTIPNAFASGNNSELSNTRSYRQGFFTTFVIDLFGGEYIRNFRISTQTNPLADLVALGNGMFNKAFDYIGWIIGTVALSGIAGIVVSVASIFAVPATGGVSIIPAIAGVSATIIGSILKPIAGILIFAATTGAAVGLFLYYIVPLLPFVFFFFSVISWILEVVEAMVGLPLWALAHIRIDGEGLSGQAGQTGYMIIFGIIVRPFVILFAFIMGIILFSAGMLMLKQMFSEYLSLMGAAEDNAISYMVFSMMYAVMSFTMAMVCFKQCDQMTNQIMRWFGGSDPRYNDGQPDPAANMERVGLGAGVLMNQGGQQLSGALSGIGEGLAGGAGKGADMYKSGKDKKAALADQHNSQSNELAMGAPNVGPDRDAYLAKIDKAHGPQMGASVRDKLT